MAPAQPVFDNRSPAAGARSVLRGLDSLWNEWAESGGDATRNTVTLELAPQMRADPTMTGARWVAEIGRLGTANVPQEERGLAIGWYLFAACGYAIDALRAHEAGRVVDAWCAAGDAHYWLGVTAGTWNVQKRDPEQAKAIGIAAISALQAQRAAKPRPKKAPTHMSVFIGAMRIARREGQSFAAFMQAAEIGSVSGLSITRMARPGIKRWTVSADDVPEDKVRSEATLESWWTAAADPERETS